MTATLDQAIAGRQHRTALSWIASRQVFWVFMAAVVACITLSLITDTFATERNLFNVTRNFAFVGIIAIGMTAVIGSGGIDLSVGSTVVLSAIVVGVLMGAGYSIWVGLGLSLAAALAVGLVNGILIARVGMPPFVVTLGMLSVARSLAMVASNNAQIWQFGPDHDLFLLIGGGASFGIADPWIVVPHPLIVLIVLAVFASIAFRWTRWGQYIFAIGGNEAAARLTGVPVTAVKISVYMFSAFTAGIAGFLLAGWLGGVTTNLGQGMELTVIAAAVIGGANLAGGAGTAFGAVVGALLIEVIRNSLTLLSISTFWQGTFVGTFIIIAVGFEHVRRLRSRD